MEILAWLVSFFLQWYVWIPLVILLSYLTWRNYQKIDNDSPSVDSVLLVLEIPRANDKSELAAEQLFASLHGILRDKKELRLSGGKQEHLSFEIASVSGQIRFYVWVPQTLQSKTLPGAPVESLCLGGALGTIMDKVETVVHGTNL